MEDFLISVLSATIIQVIGVLGVFFLLGFLLSLIQHKTHATYRSVFGWRGILWTAWIGTPIHEFGHVFFCKIFGHTITDIAIFQPNKETGGLGHVGHSYSKRNIYHQVGNFFIGAAPLLFGGASIALLLVLLVPNGKDVLAPLASSTSLSSVLLASWDAIRALLSAENIGRWDFWVFLYISFAIVSHMAPSKPDQRGMWHGFAWIIFLLVVYNGTMLAIGIDPTNFILGTGKFLTAALVIGMYALLLSALHLIAVSLLLYPLRRH